MKLYQKVAALALLVGSAVGAQDVTIGTKGPTNWQLDSRVARVESNAPTTTASTMLKYWDDKLFAFVHAPYRWTPTKAGVADMTVGVGPRGSKGNLHYLSFVGTTLPAELGAGRHDPKMGVFATLLPKNKAWEVDAELQYLVTGRNKDGSNPPNDLSLGVVAGGRVHPKVRLVAGASGFVRGETSSLTARLHTRYVHSQTWHAQLNVARDLMAHGLPESYRVECIFRYNLFN